MLYNFLIYHTEGYFNRNWIFAFFNLLIHVSSLDVLHPLFIYFLIYEWSKRETSRRMIKYMNLQTNENKREIIHNGAVFIIVNVSIYNCRSTSLSVFIFMHA